MYNVHCTVHADLCWPAARYCDKASEPIHNTKLGLEYARNISFRMTKLNLKFLRKFVEKTEVFPFRKNLNVTKIFAKKMLFQP